MNSKLSQVQQDLLLNLHEKLYVLGQQYVRQVVFFPLQEENTGNVMYAFTNLLMNVKFVLNLQFSMTDKLPNTFETIEFYVKQVVVAMMSLSPKFIEKEQLLHNNFDDICIVLDGQGLNNHDVFPLLRVDTLTMKKDRTQFVPLLPIAFEMFGRVLLELTRESFKDTKKIVETQEIGSWLLQCVDGYNSEFVSALFDEMRPYLIATGTSEEVQNMMNLEYQSYIDELILPVYKLYLECVQDTENGVAFEKVNKMAEHCFEKKVYL